MIRKIQVDEFLKLAAEHPILDVRSLGEYEHASIPRAYSLPLFSDEERKVVGTLYKQEGREQAIKKGLEYFGAKMRAMVEEAERILQMNGGNGHPSQCTVLIHCWRGGMRSAGVAWLLDLYGYKVYTLSGGYKAFRNWALQQFEKPYNFKVLGGYTGSGKTKVLRELASKGQCVIDLEQIAHHKGSAFGDLGELKQPSPEMFENRLALELEKYWSAETIWLEDESRRIGDINMPQAFWNEMRKCPLLFLDIPFEARLEYITEEYGRFKKEDLVNAVMRIRKRLGGLNAKNAINFIIEDNIKEAFRILLAYYDKYYGQSLHNRDDLDGILTKVSCVAVDTKANCDTVLALHKKQKSLVENNGNN